MNSHPGFSLSHHQNVSILVEAMVHKFAQRKSTSQNKPPGYSTSQILQYWQYPLCSLLLRPRWPSQCAPKRNDVRFCRFMQQAWPDEDQDIASFETQANRCSTDAIQGRHMVILKLVIQSKRMPTQLNQLQLMVEFRSCHSVNSFQMAHPSRAPTFHCQFQRCCGEAQLAATSGQVTCGGCVATLTCVGY